MGPFKPFVLFHVYPKELSSPNWVLYDLRTPDASPKRFRSKRRALDFVLSVVGAGNLARSVRWFGGYIGKLSMCMEISALVRELPKKKENSFVDDNQLELFGGSI